LSLPLALWVALTVTGTPRPHRHVLPGAWEHRSAGTRVLLPYLGFPQYQLEQD